MEKYDFEHIKNECVAEMLDVTGLDISFNLAKTEREGFEILRWALSVIRENRDLIRELLSEV